MQTAVPATIARRYLPSRYHYWYVRSKIATDPLYASVQAVLAPTLAPLLDVGCGVGLLLQYLRATGTDLEYHGIDFDEQKIARARKATAAGNLSGACFEVFNLAAGLPAHHGSVAILDVLQYLDERSRDELLESASRCVAGGARLVIRAALGTGNWRAAVTRSSDRLQHAIGWMKSAPRSRLTREDLQALLARHGYKSEFRPAWGNTPFSNWLVVGSR
jgi:SAM-dependent methyltransferase